MLQLSKEKKMKLDTGVAVVGQAEIETKVEDNNDI